MWRVATLQKWTKTLTLAPDRKTTFLFCAVKPNCTSSSSIYTWRLTPGGAASHDSNDGRSAAPDPPAILRGQLCYTICYTHNTHCVLKPTVSPWLFVNSYFLHSIPDSICFLSHILHTVFTPFSIFIAGVSFSLHVVASCNFLIPYGFPISIYSASSGPLYTGMGYNNSKDWVFHLISVNVSATKHPPRSLSDSPGQFRRL